MKTTLRIIIAALGFISLSWAQSPPPATSGVAPADDKAIRPFKFNSSKEALTARSRSTGSRIHPSLWPLG